MVFNIMNDSRNSNFNLREVLIRHDIMGYWEAISCSKGIVWSQNFLGHALPLYLGLNKFPFITAWRNDWFCRILIWMLIFPSSFLDGKWNCVRFQFFNYIMTARLRNCSAQELRITFVNSYLSKIFHIMNLFIWVLLF